MSNSDSKAVFEATARVLFESKAATEIKIYPETDERWGISFKVGKEDFVVASKREKVRTWVSLNSAVGWLKGLGIRVAALKIDVGLEDKEEI
ncbi:MAG: hypothetical protein ACXW00_00415 [Methylobacter sp.]|jgi:hypothetical protein